MNNSNNDVEVLPQSLLFTSPEQLKNAQDIEERGFFIGIDTKKSPMTTLKFVADKLNKVLKKYNV